MKYILKPIWILLILLLTIFEIILVAIAWVLTLVWDFKTYPYLEMWKEMHTTSIGIDDKNWKTIYGWDNNIRETITRRITDGEYEHTETYTS